MMTNRLVLLLLSLLVGSLPMFAQAQTEMASACGPLYSEGQYGPFDFRNDKSKLPIVVSRHFTPNIEALLSGNTGSIGSEIGYTLRAIPNHPNALVSMIRLAEREKTQKPNGSNYTIDCWFDRAMRFRPDDNVVRMIYATFLAKNNNTPQAITQLDRVTATAGDNPFTHYNAGLVYFDLKEFDKALTQAHKATALGLPRTELADQLKTAGKWAEPAAEMPVANTEQK
jgi:tetratricopeptide (TPR) repeat protein